MKILCFGIAKDIIGTSELILDEHQITVAQLKNQLNEKYPKLLEYKSYMIAINQEYANDESLISINDEIALIPPVSGG